MMKLSTLAAGLLLAGFSGLGCAGPLSAGTTAPSVASRGPVPVLGMAERTAYLAAFEQQVARTYVQAGLAEAELPLLVYRQAMVGFYNLRQRGLIGPRCHTLTIADFSQSSNRERLWVVNLADGRLLHRTLVAHGKNTGEEYAQTFSNVEGSEMSSLGFYVTGPTYQGRHGLSLRLRGVDKGYNTNAFGRDVVVHGASYVSHDFVSQHGRLGRSQGCPALPEAQAPAIIRSIRGGSVLFINGPQSAHYQSDLLTLDYALLAFSREALLPPVLR